MPLKQSGRIFGHYLQALWQQKRLRTRANLEEWQQWRLKRFFAKTLIHSPFYRDYAFEDFHIIPIMSKNVMMNNFDAINTAGLNKSKIMNVALAAEKSRNFTNQVNGYTVGLSSGTSGQRGLFVVSAAEQERWTGLMLARSIGARLWQRQHVALFLRSNSNLYESLNKQGHISFRYFDITQPIDGHASGLTVFDPTVITAPASVLKHIARMQMAGTIKIAPKIVFSAAEVLDPADQAYIESAFGVSVRQIYQCTEGFLGMTSAEGHFLLNEDYVLIERDYIDEKTGRFVPIITDFSRTTQPIVRYRLDDILVEDRDYVGPCLALKRIEGRCDDVFYFRSQSGHLVPVYGDTLRQTMMTLNVLYQDYQLIQGSVDTLTLKMSPMPSAEMQTGIQDAFVRLCAIFGCLPVRLTIAPYTLKIGPDKLRRVLRTWTMEEALAA